MAWLVGWLVLRRTNLLGSFNAELIYFDKSSNNSV